MRYSKPWNWLCLAAYDLDLDPQRIPQLTPN